MVGTEVVIDRPLGVGDDGECRSARGEKKAEGEDLASLAQEAVFPMRGRVDRVAGPDPKAEALSVSIGTPG